MTYDGRNAQPQPVDFMEAKCCLWRMSPSNGKHIMECKANKVSQYECAATGMQRALSDHNIVLSLIKVLLDISQSYPNIVHRLLRG